ncbi:MAG: hypothetical protein A3F77_08695 [Betaproteobacteria bacterium RIFCSPLOWO2_12_FULL_67_28]|nr:MAG: hypothetical protein A3F77_08695 [Betaproteobacteria bacterium RIFCSPLOWO2_12_FULL_67_28]
MRANESRVRNSATRIEVDCAHDDRVRIEPSVIGASLEPSRSNFLRVSAAYMLGAGCGDPDAPVTAGRTSRYARHSGKTG